MNEPDLQLPIWMVTLVGRLTIELELARQEADALRQAHQDSV